MHTCGHRTPDRGRETGAESSQERGGGRKRSSGSRGREGTHPYSTTLCLQIFQLPRLAAVCPLELAACALGEFFTTVRNALPLSLPHTNEVQSIEILTDLRSQHIRWTRAVTVGAQLGLGNRARVVGIQKPPYCCRFAPSCIFHSRENVVHTAWCTLYP